MDNNTYYSLGNSPLDSQGSIEAPTSHSTKPSRRAHPKTRTGCNVCKRRKIKCDEQRPSCRNCAKHGVECDFAKARPLSIRLGPSADPDINLTDLELLHNFTTSTCNTLVEDTCIRNLWKFGIIRMAVKNKYLMRGILSISALHMALNRPEQKEFYISYAVEQHQIASRTAVELMSNVKPDNCEPLWVFSVLTIYYALGSPREDNPSLMSGDTLFPNWLFLLDGVRHLLETFESTSYRGELTPILDRGRKRWQDSHQPQYAKSNILDKLESSIKSTVTDSSLVFAYCEAIGELRPHLSFALSGHNQTLDMTDAFVWHYTLNDDFIALLKTPTQEAVVIFAHFCIILSRAQRNWWVQGWDTFLISRAWDILDCEHRLWIQWPIEEIGWVPP